MNDVCCLPASLFVRATPKRCTRERSALLALFVFCSVRLADWRYTDQDGYAECRIVGQMSGAQRPRVVQRSATSLHLHHALFIVDVVDLICCRCAQLCFLLLFALLRCSSCQSRVWLIVFEVRQQFSFKLLQFHANKSYQHEQSRGHWFWQKRQRSIKPFSM